MTTNVPPPNTARRWVGMNLRHLRTKKELTLEQFAERVTALGFGIDKASLSRIENGRTNVDVEKLLAFAEALDVVPDRLLRDPADLDRAIFDRLCRRFIELSTEWLAATTRAKVVWMELERLSEGSPDLEEELEELVDALRRSEMHARDERVPFESPDYERYLNELMTGPALVATIEEKK